MALAKLRTGKAKGKGKAAKGKVSEVVVPMSHHKETKGTHCFHADGDEPLTDRIYIRKNVAEKLGFDHGDEIEVIVRKV